MYVKMCFNIIEGEINKKWIKDNFHEKNTLKFYIHDNWKENNCIKSSGHYTNLKFLWY
jgi:hypothetical protein